MGRLTEKAHKAARASSRNGRAYDVARRAQAWLASRGIAVPLRELRKRTIAECIDAVAWARMRRPLSVRPKWLGELVSSERAGLLPGVCSNCGCSDDQECAPFGCLWVNAEHTLCSECEDPCGAGNPPRAGPTP